MLDVGLYRGWRCFFPRMRCGDLINNFFTYHAKPFWKGEIEIGFIGGSLWKTVYFDGQHFSDAMPIPRKLWNREVERAELFRTKQDLVRFKIYLQHSEVSY